MRILKGDEEHEAYNFLHDAELVAKNATCERSKCGSIIIKNHKRIGEGYNSPPGEKETQRRCSCDKTSYHSKITDKTCCIHAEQRAIMDALRKNPENIRGSRLYFIRLDAEGKPVHAGKPYCTICSKLALDAGIAEFILWHEQGITVYDTEEYNLLSYKYTE